MEKPSKSAAAPSSSSSSSSSSSPITSQQQPKKVPSSAAAAKINASSSSSSSGRIEHQAVGTTTTTANTTAAPVENARRRKELSNQASCSITITHSLNSSVPFNISCASNSSSSPSANSNDPSKLPALSVMPIILVPTTRTTGAITNPQTTSKAIKSTVGVAGTDIRTVNMANNNTTTTGAAANTIRTTNSGPLLGAGLHFTAPVAATADVLMLSASTSKTTTASLTAATAPPTLSFITTSAGGRRPQVTLSMASSGPPMSTMSSTSKEHSSSSSNAKPLATLGYTTAGPQPTKMLLTSRLATIPKINAIKDALPFNIANSITITAKPMHGIAVAGQNPPTMVLNGNVILSSAAKASNQIGGSNNANNATAPSTTAAAAVAMPTVAPSATTACIPPGTTITKISTPAGTSSTMGRPQYQAKTMHSRQPLPQQQQQLQQANSPAISPAVVMVKNAAPDNSQPLLTRPSGSSGPLVDIAKRPLAQYKNLNSYMLANKNSAPPPLVLPSMSQIAMRGGPTSVVLTTAPASSSTSSAVFPATAMSSIGDTKIYFANTMNQRQQLQNAGLNSTPMPTGSSFQLVRSASGNGTYSVVATTSGASQAANAAAAAPERIASATTATLAPISPPFTGVPTQPTTMMTMSTTTTTTTVNNTLSISGRNRNARTINVQISNGMLSDPQGPIRLLTTCPVETAPEQQPHAAIAAASASVLPRSPVRSMASMSPSRSGQVVVCLPRSPRLLNRSRSLMIAPSASRAKPLKAKRAPRNVRLPSEPSKLMQLMHIAKVADIPLSPATQSVPVGKPGQVAASNPSSSSSSINIETSDLSNICNSLFDATAAPPPAAAAPECPEQVDMDMDADPKPPPTNFFSAIRWRKEIGYVPMSSVVYVRNEFNLIEPAVRHSSRINKVFERHINESVKIKMYNKRNNTTDPYPLRAGAASNPRREVRRRTRAPMPRAGNAIPFNWHSHLLVLQAETAPEHLFANPFPSTTNRFAVGMKLEAIDPQNQSRFCVCTVIETRGFRLRIAIDGFSWAYAFWCNADSLDIFPPGWCSTTGRKLMTPPAAAKPFDWFAYINASKAVAAPRSLFQHLNMPPVENPFCVGMKLEADDTRNTGKLCVATVGDVLGNRILVTFDGGEEKYSYWTDIGAPCIHPVNWHQDGGFNVIGPSDAKDPFEWATYPGALGQRLAMKEMFVVRKQFAFKVGMKLEVVDKKNRQLIRPASIVNVDEFMVKVLFDGWPERYAFWLSDDDPDLHPAYWCQRTGHPLEGPPVTNYQSQSGCGSYGCRSIGHANNPNVSTHVDNNDCPYYVKNWDRLEKGLPNRIEVLRNAECARKRQVRAAAAASNSNHNTPTTSQPAAEQRPAEQPQAMETNEPEVHVKVEERSPSPPEVSARTSTPQPMVADQPTAGPPASSAAGPSTSQQSNSPSNDTNNAALSSPVKREPSGSDDSYGSTSTVDVKDRVSAVDDNDSVGAVDANVSVSPANEPGEPEPEAAQPHDSPEPNRAEQPSDDTSDEDDNGVPTDNLERRLRAIQGTLEEYATGYAGGIEAKYHIWRRHAQELLGLPQYRKRRQMSPMLWSPGTVAMKVGRLAGCADLSKRFKKHIIDGYVLLVMSLQDLMESPMNPTYGQAVKVAAYIQMLRQELDEDNCLAPVYMNL